MNQLVVKIKTNGDTPTSDEVIVDESMTKLMEMHPSIDRYSWMRDGQEIYIFITGDFEIVGD